MNIVISGEAGQGLVTVGTVLAKSLVRHGFDICVTQGYESRIRGGHNTFKIRAGAGGILAPAEGTDIDVALDKGRLKYDGLETALPLKALASVRTQNTAALGIIAKVLGLDRKIVAGAAGEIFSRKGAEVIEENERVLDAAYEWASSQAQPRKKLPPPNFSKKRLIMNGNDAVAFGAMTAGLKFYSFYPMTPSTSIGLMLAANAKQLGMIVEQAEDEIAAINMAIGASFAGAPAMVATSGGGFALMVEGVSLAAMTETPVVIVVGQRPAPATGLPTRTEQGDLEFVLHAGHGEFPRAVFAPTCVEECFHLTRRAFMLAEKYQGPVFILTDQFMADSYRAVEPFDIGDLKPVAAGVSPACVKPPYRRYALTENGISPRLMPGLSEHLVVADSDEHTEDGHLTEDLAVRKLMVEKRLKKMKGLAEEACPPNCEGPDDPELLLVTWGSTAGSVGEAAKILRARGMKAAVLSFSQVWPLCPDMFMKRIESARRVVCVEGNATGQFARLIRRETGFDIEKRVLRYDGLPVTLEYVLRGIGE